MHILDEIVEFGRYEQDGNVENGKEGIEWFIIQETDSYKLLLSRCALEIRPMDELTIDSFENSSLCAWLNTTFYESFNEDERRKMLGLKLDDEGRTIGVLENETQLPYVSLLSLSDAKNLIERNVYLFPIHSIGSDNWENDIKLTLWLSTVNEYAFGSTGYCVDKYNVIAEMLVSSENYIIPVICIKK